MSTDEIIALYVIYTLAAGLMFFYGWSRARDLARSRWVEERARWARIALSAPVWPLTLLVVAAVFMTRLIKDLVDWSRAGER